MKIISALTILRLFFQKQKLKAGVVGILVYHQ